MATKTFKDNALRIIAVIGLIAVLLLGAWGIIQLAFFIPGFLSNLAGGVSAPKAAETLSVSVPMAAGSDQAFPLSWTHKNGSGQYGYTVAYACTEGLSMKAPLPNGTLQNVPCNTPFNYLNATNTTPIIASVSGDKSVTATFTITATKLSSGAVTATGSASASIAPAKKAAATPAKTPAKTTTPAKTSYVASGRTTNLYGSPDLSVRILSNPGTVTNGQQIPLQFVVENVGTNVTPANWMFTASLPYSPVYTYQSPAQQALYPGDKIVYTLSYTAVAQNYLEHQYLPTQPGDPYQNWSYPYSTLGNAYSAYPYGTTQTASVTVDPYNQVWETSEYNNTASITYSVY